MKTSFLRGLSLFVAFLAAVAISLYFITSSQWIGKGASPWQLPFKADDSLALAIIALVVGGVAYLVSTWVREIKHGYGMEGIIQQAKMPNRGPKEESMTLTAQELKDVLSYATDEGEEPLFYPSDLALATFFLTASITPKEVFTVIDEKVRTDTRSLRVVSSISIKVPFNFQGSSVVIPALFFPRNAFPDALLVESSSGCDISGLNLEETMDYIEGLILLCLEELNEEKNSEVRSDILKFIKFGYDVSSETVTDRWKTYKELCCRIDEIFTKSSECDVERALVIKRFLELLIEGYPICVRCGMEKRKKVNVTKEKQHQLLYSAESARAEMVKISYRTPLVHVPRRNVLWEEGERRVIRYLSSLFSNLIKRPNTIYYGLGNADRTQSYHLQVAGPEKTFCSFVALKCRGAQCKEKANPESQGESAEGDNKDITDIPAPPMADIAISQTRCGQRHFWFCAKNGSGFTNWTLVYRHMPRYLDAFRVSLIAASVALAAIWAILVSPKGCPDTGSDVSVITALLAILAPVAMTWIGKENTSVRGTELGPTMVSAVIVVSALFALGCLAGEGSLCREICSAGLRACFLLLAGCVVLLLLRAMAWAIILWKMGKEKAFSVNLTKGINGNLKDDAIATMRRACVWCPGWEAVDANRYISNRFNCQEAKAAIAAYAERRRYVRDSFVHWKLNTKSDSTR